MDKVTRLFDIPYYQLTKYDLSNTFVTKYNNIWEQISTKNYIEKSNALSRFLIHTGIKRNDKIAIITNRSRTEWHIADIAIMQVGAQSVPIYDSTSLIDLNYIFNHAEIKHCFIANKELFDKVSKVKSKYLKNIFSFDNIEGCINITDAIEEGNTYKNQALIDYIKLSIKPNDLATIIYTSGTTDKPKGVMLSHKNIISNLNACIPILPIFNENDEPKALSLLPVSHIFERMMLYLYQYNGYSIYFAESIETVASDMSVVKPHIMTVVPRLLEKIHDKILAKGNALGTIKRKLFNWALDLGYKYEPYGQNGSSYERSLKRARKLIFSKWKDVFGGNIKVIFCGSSKLQPRLTRIFNAAGIPIMDGYGLTETSPVISVNSPNDMGMRIGSIGKPVNNVHVKISEDGEILSKGSNNMLGYYKNDIKTEVSFKEDYFKTGDLGRIDEDGFLYITGRKKETFKTSGGKYITPSKIESELKKSVYIEQIMVIGEGEKMPAAIIQPNFELLKANLSLDINNKQFILEKIVIKKIQSEIDIVNKTLGQWEKIKRFELTDDEWTIEAGHLTPTMKVKKDIIKAKYYYLYNKIYR